MTKVRHRPIPIKFFSDVTEPDGLFLGQLIGKKHTVYGVVCKHTDHNNRIHHFAIYSRYSDIETIIRAREDLREQVRKLTGQAISPLQKEQEYAISKGSMEFTAQEIIDKALTVTTPTGTAVRAPHPEPDTRDELRVIVDQAAHLDSVLAELRERGMPLTTPEVEVAINALHEIATRSAVTAWRLGLHAVDRNLVSQRRLGELLEASNQTVNRRYRQGITEDEEEKIARSDGRTLPL